jgi:HK97 family phage major capsid protein
MWSKRFRALQQQRADLVAKAKGLLGAEEQGVEAQAQADSILATEIPAIDVELKRFEALQDAERTAPAVSSIRVTDNVERDPMRGFRSMADFAQSVRLAAAPGGNIDQRLIGLFEGKGGPQAAPTNYHQEGHSVDGYMVPPQVREEIWQLVFSGDDLLGLVETEPTESNSFELTADESTPWGATGVLAYWTPEAGQMTKSRLATEPRQGKLHKLTAFVLSTDELLADAPKLSVRLTTGSARAIGWKASNALMRGTGVGMPLGWLNAACKVEVAKQSAQTADTIVAQNILKMYSRRLVLPGGRWLWLANSDIVPQLVDLKIGNEPAWAAQNGGLKVAPEGSILGLPVKFVEHCSTLGDAGDIQLADLAGYYAAIKSGGIKFDSSIHLYFDYNVTAFRWVFRIGGMPFLSTAVSPANGSNTKSQFITLAERA